MTKNSLFLCFSSRRSDAPSRPFRLLCSLIFVLVSKTHVCASKDNVSYLIPEHQGVSNKRQELVPFPRLGRSSNDIQELLLSLREESLTSKGKNKYEPGKKKHQHKNPDPYQPASEYMLPYLRPGRSDGTDDPPPDNNNDDEPDEDTMIPYPRFGRSTSRYANGLDYFYYPNSAAHFSKVSYISHPKVSNSLFSKRDDDDDQTIIPYPRFGKRLSALDNIWPFGKKSESESNREAEEYQNYLLKSYVEGDADYITPYPRMGKRSLTSMPQARFGKKSSTTEEYPDVMTPYPRFGKRQAEDMVIPYPRFGKRQAEDMVIPYPRFGKRQAEDMVIPYPRFGKRQAEDLVIPYPRMGRDVKSSENLRLLDFPGQNRNRKSFDAEEDMDLMLPLPRFGRSVDKLNAKGKNSALKVASARQDRSDFERSDADINSRLSDKVVAQESSAPRGRAKRAVMVSENGPRMPSEGRGMVTYRRVTKKDDQSSSRKENSNGKGKMHFNKYPYDMEEQNYMLPYMRPGRSNINKEYFI